MDPDLSQPYWLPFFVSSAVVWLLTFVLSRISCFYVPGKPRFRLLATGFADHTAQTFATSTVLFGTLAVAAACMATAPQLSLVLSILVLVAMPKPVELSLLAAFASEGLQCRGRRDATFLITLHRLAREIGEAQSGRFGTNVPLTDLMLFGFPFNFVVAVKASYFDSILSRDNKYYIKVLADGKQNAQTPGPPVKGSRWAMHRGLTKSLQSKKLSNSLIGQTFVLALDRISGVDVQTPQRLQAKTSSRSTSRGERCKWSRSFSIESLWLSTTCSVWFINGSSGGKPHFLSGLSSTSNASPVCPTTPANMGTPPSAG